MKRSNRTRPVALAAPLSVDDRFRLQLLAAAALGLLWFAVAGVLR